MTPNQLYILLTPTTLQQVLAAADSVTEWSFPISYTGSAQTAQINIDGTVIPLESGQTSQPISGSGSTVTLNVDLGTSEQVKVAANPYNQKDCTNPFISFFSADDETDTFQIACAGEKTTWNINIINVEFPSQDPETPATTVTLVLDGSAFQQLSSGSSSFSPSGMTLGFSIANFQSGTLKIIYTLQAAAVAT